MRTSTIRAVTALAALALTLGLGACGGSTATTSTTTPAASAAKGTGQAASVTISNPWVKAVDTGMTGAFFLLKNTGSAPVHVVSASSSVSPKMELHETVMGSGGAMQMQEKKGGFTIAAGGSHEFKPGSDHVMFMGVNAPVKSGTTLTFTLAFEDGSTLPITAEVRTFTGAKETYVPGATTGSHSMPGMTGSGMTMGTHG
jgi:copper(I)-binding protein